MKKQEFGIIKEKAKLWREMDFLLRNGLIFLGPRVPFANVLEQFPKFTAGQVVLFHEYECYNKPDTHQSYKVKILGGGLDANHTFGIDNYYYYIKPLEFASCNRLVPESRLEAIA